MDKQVSSSFRLQAARMIDFHFINRVRIGSSLSEEQIKHEISGKYNVTFHDGLWLGVLVIEYSAVQSIEAPLFSLSARMEALFSFRGPDTAKDQFVRLLHFNGALSAFAILRGNIATTSTALGLSPSLIVPSVNLNAFTWEEIAFDDADESAEQAESSKE